MLSVQQVEGFDPHSHSGTKAGKSASVFRLKNLEHAASLASAAKEGDWSLAYELLPHVSLPLIFHRPELVIMALSYSKEARRCMKAN